MKLALAVLIILVSHRVERCLSSIIVVFRIERSVREFVFQRSCVRI